MKKLFALTFLAMFLSFASFALIPLTGYTFICIGSPVYVSEDDSLSTGGTWTSSDITVATVAFSGTSSAIITGVSSGVATITYTLGTSYVTETVTVNAAPGAVSGGATSFCVGATATFTDATAGGVWSSDTYIATVDSTTGIVTGVHGGTTDIYYTIADGCSSFMTITIDATSAGYIGGAGTVCAGSTITIYDSSATAAGTWSSSNPSVATISSSGVVTGVAGGTVTITYTCTGPCGTAYTTTTITVSTTTSPGVITGPSLVAVGLSITLSDGWSGTWSSSNPAIASVGSYSGVVTGVAAGTATITYSVSGCGGLADTTTTITVTPHDTISGNIIFGSGAYYGDVTVYLITYNPSTYDLEAMDSAIFPCSGTSVYYQFIGIPTDSIRVKAATTDSTGSITTSGYIPTYHTSSFYWHDADVIYHTAGTSDINEDINMSSGTATTGTGFIGGSVLTGANRGTSGAIPSVGMRMCVVNSTSGQLIESTKTDASGNYSFNNLPVGQTYLIFPDSLNYLTTPYTGITLTTASPSVTSIGFIQHTVSHTTTPVNVGVKNLSSSVSSVITFPNPTTGKLNIQWNENATEKGTVTITDITGREIYTATLMMNQGSGVNQVDLSNLTNGLYLISIKTASIDYNNKIQIMQ